MILHTKEYELSSICTFEKILFILDIYLKNKYLEKKLFFFLIQVCITWFAFVCSSTCVVYSLPNTYYIISSYYLINLIPASWMHANWIEAQSLKHKLKSKSQCCTVSTQLYASLIYVNSWCFLLILSLNRISLLAVQLIQMSCSDARKHPGKQGTRTLIQRFI